MASIIRSIFMILTLIFLIAIPAIPGAILWWFLKPVMFWEKFAWIVTSMVFYLTIIFLYVFIFNVIYKGESKKETINENRSYE
jgi:hypothetical protein